MSWIFKLYSLPLPKHSNSYKDNIWGGNQAIAPAALATYQEEAPKFIQNAKGESRNLYGTSINLNMKPEYFALKHNSWKLILPLIDISTEMNIAGINNSYSKSSRHKPMVCEKEQLKRKWAAFWVDLDPGLLH